MTRALLSACMVLCSIAAQAGSLCSALFEKDPVAYFNSESHRRRFAPIETDNSAAQLLDSAASILKTLNPSYGRTAGGFFEIRRGKFVTESNLPREWQTKTGRRIPLDAIYATQSAVVEALLRVGMTRELSDEFGFRIQKKLVEALGEKWSEYVSFVNSAQTQVQIRISSERLRRATEQLSQLIELDRSFDIPYVAGYAKNTFKKIYIDRDVQKKVINRAGKFVSVDPFLVIHEVVEKSLMDLLHLTEKSYARTHQIAQRLEQEAIEAFDVSWQHYQNEVMKKEIARADIKDLKRVPADLDMTPYMDEPRDHALIARMRKAMKASSRAANGLFKVKQVRPGVFFLHFRDQREMAATMMRFQEHFESPEFRGKIFLRSEFRKWVKEKNGKFNYYEWDGFNFPGEMLEAFYKGKFLYLTENEKLILKAFALRRHASTYIIASAEDSNATTFEHEVAHSLYHFNSAYRNEIRAVLAQVDTGSVKKVLFNEVGDYHRRVLDDEVHAWLMNNGPELESYGLDLNPYKGAITQLQAIYKNYDDAAYLEPKQASEK